MVAIIHLGAWLPKPSRDLPEHLPANRPLADTEVSGRNVFQFGLAPDGVYHARFVTIAAVGSYPTFSPLPNKLGGLFSVALSLKFPLADVIRRHICLEPGLSSYSAFRRLKKQSPDHLVITMCTFWL